MSEAKTQNIHATCVDMNGAGILLLGKSGSGKSDLALRLIENKGARLVADDRVNLYVDNQKLIASVPETLQNLLEVRGVGIIKMTALPQTTVRLAVGLADKTEEVERLPEPAFFEVAGVRIELLKIRPFEVSAADKIVIKLKAVLD